MNSVAFNSIQDIEEGMFFIQSSYSVGYARIHTEKKWLPGNPIISQEYK